MKKYFLKLDSEKGLLVSNYISIIFRPNKRRKLRNIRMERFIGLFLKEKSEFLNHIILHAYTELYSKVVYFSISNSS